MARRLIISGELAAVDFERFGPDEHASKTVRGETILTDSLPQDVLRMDLAFGGEIRIEVQLIGQVRDNEDILVTGNMKLFEGTTEGTKDLDGELNFTVLVPRGSTVPSTQTVRNTAERKADSATLTMNLVNADLAV